MFFLRKEAFHGEDNGEKLVSTALTPASGHLEEGRMVQESVIGEQFVMLFACSVKGICGVGLVFSSGGVIQWKQVKFQVTALL